MKKGFEKEGGLPVIENPKKNNNKKLILITGIILALIILVIAVFLIYDYFSDKNNLPVVPDDGTDRLINYTDNLTNEDLVINDSEDDLQQMPSSSSSGSGSSGSGSNKRCIPNCNGKECGDNGCGGICNVCNDPLKPFCEDYKCVSNVIPVAYNETLYFDEDEKVDFTLKAEDADGDKLTYHLSKKPERDDISDGTSYPYIPRINYSLPVNWYGIDYLEFYVNDSKNISNLARVDIIINPVNDIPDFYYNWPYYDIKDLYFALEGESAQIMYRIPVKEYDLGEKIYYSGENLPVGAVIDSDKGFFEWTISQANIGTYPNVTFKVNDGVNFVSKNMTLIVKPKRVVYADLQLSADCKSTYSIANRNCLGSDGDAFSTLKNASKNLTYADDLVIRGGVYHEGLFLTRVGRGSYTTVKPFGTEEVILDGTEKLSNWVKCASQEACLENPNWSNIYYTEFNKSYASNVLRASVYEDEKFLQMAINPNQGNPALRYVGEFKKLKSESWGLYDSIIDSEFLNQEDDYWNNAYLFIHSRCANNALLERKVADYIKAEHRIVFDKPLDAAICEGDSYAIVNHPSVLDTPGEYYINNLEEINQKYKIYLWPREQADLAEKIGIAVPKTGIDIYSGNANDVIIQGLKIRLFSGGGILTSGWNYNSNIILRNNYVGNIIGDCIFLRSGYYNVVEGNKIENCIVSRGITCGGYGTTIQNNWVNNTEHTLIYVPGSKRTRVINNTVGTGGNHANGITAYQYADEVLIAGNKVHNQLPITLQNSDNVIVYNNILSGGYLADWDNMKGYVKLFNNIFFNGIYLYSPDEIVVKNNLVVGGAPGNHDYNVYIGSSGFSPVGNELYSQGILRTSYGPRVCNASVDRSKVFANSYSLGSSISYYSDLEWWNRTKNATLIPIVPCYSHLIKPGDYLVHSKDLNSRQIVNATSITYSGNYVTMLNVTPKFENLPSGNVYIWHDVSDLNLDYHHKENGLGVDSGIDIRDEVPSWALEMYDFSKDYDGNPRGVNAGWDIGPYEYQEQISGLGAVDESINYEPEGLSQKSVLSGILNWVKGIMTGNTIKDITGNFIKLIR